MSLPADVRTLAIDGVPAMAEMVKKKIRWATKKRKGSSRKWKSKYILVKKEGGAKKEGAPKKDGAAKKE